MPVLSKISPKAAVISTACGKPFLLCGSEVLAAAGEGIREQTDKQPEKLVLYLAGEVSLKEPFKQHLLEHF